MKNQKGEIATAVVIAIAVGSLLIGTLIPKLNPFKLFGEKNAANKKASFTLQKETSTPILIESKEGRPLAIGKKIELVYNTGMEEAPQVLTYGQRVGKFLAGLTNGALIAILVALIFFPGAFITWIWTWGRGWRQTAKTTVSGLRNADPDTYDKIKPLLAAEHDKADKKRVDKLKSELH